jgi:hypothetical protein
MTTIEAVEPVSDSERDARRAKLEARKAEATRARAALKRAEAALRVCDENIKMHRAAIRSNERDLKARKAERAGLVGDRKQYRKEAARTAAKAEKAEARYDGAVLARVVEEAKDAELAGAASRGHATKKRSAGRSKSKTPRRRSSITKRTARRAGAKSNASSAKKTSTAKRSAKRTGRASGA